MNEKQLTHLKKSRQTTFGRELTQQDVDAAAEHMKHVGRNKTPPELAALGLDENTVIEIPTTSPAQSITLSEPELPDKYDNAKTGNGKSRVRARIYKKRIAELEAAIKASAQMHREAIENQEKAHRMIIAQDFVQHQQELQIWKDRAKRYRKDCIALEMQVECLQYRIDRIMELVERPPVVDSIRAILTEPPAETHHAEGIENR